MEIDKKILEDKKDDYGSPEYKITLGLQSTIPWPSASDSKAEMEDSSMTYDKKVNQFKTEQEKLQYRMAQEKKGPFVFGMAMKDGRPEEKVLDLGSDRVAESFTSLWEANETTCTRCSKIIESGDRACRYCGCYVLKPGETIDLSRNQIVWGHSRSISARTVPKVAENEFDTPVPMQTTPDIADCPETNAWVFNHLPLTEEQKEKLKMELMRDEAKKKRDKTSAALRQEQQKEKALRRAGIKKESNKARPGEGPRTFVKREIIHVAPSPRLKVPCFDFVRYKLPPAIRYDPIVHNLKKYG